MAGPVAELRFEGEIVVQPYRRGTYLGTSHLEELIERTLAQRYSYGKGWRGRAVVSIRFFEEQPETGEAA